MLEPSCGIGRFLEYHNPELIDAYEIDKYAHLIATLKFPKANIKLQSIEERFFNGQFHAPHRVKPEYDLVIGNPPFGLRGQLALKFINHASEFSEYVCFVGILQRILHKCT